MAIVQTITKSIQDLPRKEYPVKILQFGSGNFLRGFADWIIQITNDKTGFNGGVSIVQSISSGQSLIDQKGLYSVVLKGIREEEFVSRPYKIDVIQRVVNPAADFCLFLDEALNPDLQIIISNTTEAGIIFSTDDTSVATVASTFPGKLTQLLYKRFQSKVDSNLVILPTELIEQNGKTLKGCIQKYASHWKLPAEFLFWINTYITFCNTLVDRIVSGFPKKSKTTVFAELGYADELVVEGEWFHLWVIEGPRWIEEVLPFKKAGLNVIYTHDLAPYRLRKVRILNGAHTCMACVGYLAGLQTVREAIEHPVIGSYLKRIIYDDIVPNIPGDLFELEKYADEVIDRFRNPAIEHLLHSISLSSFPKFSVRVMPSILAQLDKSQPGAKRLVYAFAALLYFYRGEKDGVEFQLKDNAEVIDFMHSIWATADFTPNGLTEISRQVLAQQKWWGQDLTQIPGLVDMVGHYLYEINRVGILESLRKLSHS